MEEEEEKKKLVCNDCGCRFEAGIAEETETPKKQAEQPAPALCPECKSMNITTA